MRRAAGILACAIAAIALGGAAPAAAGTVLGLARDCGGGGGLLSGVTGGLCELVDGATTAVGSLTGGALGPVTDGLDRTVGGVADPLDGGAQTPKAPGLSVPGTPGVPKPAPATERADPLLPSVLDEVCLPLLPCETGSGTAVAPSPTPAETTGAPTRPAPADARPAPAGREQSAGPSMLPAPPDSRPYLLNSTEHVFTELDDPADLGEAGLGLLWPGPLAERLRVRLGDRQGVRPSGNDSDTLGTALTATLLTSALLATRIVHKRRRRTEERASIPFEPVRVGGRHRLA